MKIERIESCKWKDGVTSTNLTGKLGGNKPDQDDKLNKSKKIRGDELAESRSSYDFGAERNWFKRQRRWGCTGCVFLSRYYTYVLRVSELCILVVRWGFLN